MMKWFLLVLAILASSAQTTLNKQFGGQKKRSAVTYSAMQVFSAMFFFLVLTVMRGSFVFSLPLFLYAFAFAIVYGTAVVCTLHALILIPD